jgi:hypothetical protein
VELAHDDGEFGGEVGEDSNLVAEMVELAGEDVVARARVDGGVINMKRVRGMPWKAGGVRVP